MDPLIQKQLKVYCNIVQRLEKEILFYEQELQQQEQRVQTLQDTGANIHDIRKQASVTPLLAKLSTDTNMPLNSEKYYKRP